MARLILLLCAFSASVSACSNDKSPAAPTPRAMPTRIIRLGGNLNFGNVVVGQEPPDGLLTVSNDGTANLTVSGISSPCGGAAITAIGSTAFAVAPQSTVNVTVRFRPMFVLSCTGTITVTSDATSGTGTIQLTAAGIAQPPPPAPSVEYRLTGSARHCSATYENSTGGTNQQGVNIPFSYSWSGARSGDFLYFSCQIDQSNDSGDLTVAIYKNGTFYRSGFASGFPNIASASGSY